MTDTARYEDLFLANLGMIEGVIRFVSRRQHLRAEEADEFESEVRFRLITDDYAVFREFQHRSSLRTYLTIVIQRIYLDYRNRGWGRWRPSAEARRLGPVAIRLECLMGRDRLSFDQACEYLRTNERLTDSRADLEAIAARLPSRPGRVNVNEEAIDERPAVGPHRFEDPARSGERRAAGHRIVAALTAAAEALDDEDRLILRLRFQEDLSVADIARAMHLAQKPLYRRLETLLQKLRRALEAAGIDRLEADEIVNRNDVDISLALLGEVPAASGARSS